MANEWLFERMAAIAIEEGDLRPLIGRVKARKTLTDAEWQVIQQVLEAAAAGKKGWRPPKRPKFSDLQIRRRAFEVLFQYYHARLVYGTGGQPVQNRTHEEAVSLVAKIVRLGESRVEQYLGIARRDPKIMGDDTVKAMVEAFERRVSKEDWEARKR